VPAEPLVGWPLLAASALFGVAVLLAVARGATVRAPPDWSTLLAGKTFIALDEAADGWMGLILCVWGIGLAIPTAAAVLVYDLPTEILGGAGIVGAWSGYRAVRNVGRAIAGLRCGPAALALARPRFQGGEELSGEVVRAPGGLRVESYEIEVRCVDTFRRKVRRGKTSSMETKAHVSWTGRVEVRPSPGTTRFGFRLRLPASVTPPDEIGDRERQWSLRISGGGRFGFSAAFEPLPVDGVEEGRAAPG
jgi:hypothetical protein